MFDTGIHTYTCEHMSWHSRNLTKPLFEVWALDFRFLFINAALSAKSNPILFKTKIYDKIFKKYEIQKTFNKLMSKQYYDAEIKMDKFKIGI